MALPVWNAHPNCPAHLRGAIEQRVRALPAHFLEEPEAGEVFGDVDLCQERLQGWALSQGFAIARLSGSMKQVRPRFYFRCIHHGKETANTRNLEEHVDRNKEGKITTRRQRESTNINARDCPYFVYLSYKQIGQRGTREYGLVLGVKNNAHSHTMAVNPLIYSEHRRSIPGYGPALELGKSLRSAYISYSAARRVLEQAGFPLDRNTYYNLRHRSVSADKDDFAGLVVALEDAGFVFECRIEEEIDPYTGKVLDAQLQQIWFSHPDQIRYAQRFIAGWTLFIDGTFGTNARNLVLLVQAGITNCGNTFVAALSYARSESKMSFDFVFQSLKQRIFHAPIPLPRVVISDQATGMTASLPKALPGTLLQYCDWHAVENMMKRLADRGYKKEERETLKHLIWSFVKARTQDELAEKRAEIHSKLKQSEISYLTDYWGPREAQFLRIYTRRFPNLGSHSNQRSESIHPVTTRILNKNLSMEEATRRLSETLKAKLRELDEIEASTGSKLPRTLDRKAFQWLADTVTFTAIAKISVEWEATKTAFQNGLLLPTTTPCTDCELLVRFGLPCKHYLIRACVEGSPIPRSLLHPRWWVHSEPIKVTAWTPIYQTFALPVSPARPTVAHPYVSPRRNEITGLGLQVLEAREELTGYARQRYEAAATQAQRGLVEFAQDLRQDDLHVRMPDIVKKPFWNRQLKSHDKANKRLMTGAEASERDANQREQAATREARSETPLSPSTAVSAREVNKEEDTVTLVPDSPLRTPPALDAGGGAGAEAHEATVIVRATTTPEGGMEEGEEEEKVDEAFIPPPSTAPPVMSRAGRKRAPTMKALEAEKAPKRGGGRGRGKGRGRGYRGLKE